MLHSLPAFSHFPRYPQAKWALLVPIPGWVGLCTFWDPMGLSNELSPVRLGVSPSAASTHTGVFNQWVEVLFPRAGALGLCSLFHSPFDPPGLSARECGICQPLLAPPAAHSMASLGPPATALPWRESSIPCCPSLPLLPVWMNVSSLTPWLSDLHTVRFSVSSGCFLFLNCCCPFFWLWEEAQCVYLRLHLGRKYPTISFYELQQNMALMIVIFIFI